MIYFFDGVKPLHWKDFAVKEGAGAAFLTKEEIAQMEGVSLLVKTFVAEYCLRRMLGFSITLFLTLWQSLRILQLMLQ